MKTKLSLLVILALTLTPVAKASPVTTDYISAPDGLTIVVGKRTYSVPSTPQSATAAIVDTTSSQTLTNKTFDNTSNVAKRIAGLWDYSAQGGVPGTYALGMTIPASALITTGYIDVITAPGTSTGTPKIAVGCEAAGDILAATNYSNLVAGLSIGKPGAGDTAVLRLASALPVVTASACNLVISNSATLSTGKIKVFLEYLAQGAI